MSDLRERITARISTLGPMPVAEYMAICLFDERDGYYMVRDPLGRDGDFTTAPEISQIFGELVASWLIALWRLQGRPENPLFAEIGPGRGTLARDLCRTLDRLEPGLRERAGFHFIETSTRLSATQAKTLEGMAGPLHWFKSVDELPANRPLFIVGNELLDAIPFRQFVRTSEGWRGRCVSLDAEGQFVFCAGATMIDPRELPPEAATASEGAIFETAPAREGLMQTVAQRIASDGGAALFFDYGHLTPGLGDTFQAMRAHSHVDPLLEPGLADLTSHVDFAAVAQAVRNGGLLPQTATQGDFLVALGLLERAGQLGANRTPAFQDSIRRDVERLAGPDDMGNLFKVIGFAASGPDIPGFAPAS